MAVRVRRADIAESLNLSLSVVKRALGNYTGVSRETKARVWAEAERLGYKHNALNADVAVIMPCVPSYFWSELRAHLDFYINKEEITHRFFFFHDINIESDAIQCIDSALECGASVFICALPDTQALRDRIDSIKDKVKVILVEEFLDIEACYYIGEAPYEEGHQLAMRYLSMYKDRRRFLVFGSRIRKKTGRTEGFLAALKEEGISVLSEEATVNIDTKTRAAILAREIKKHIGRIDCIFCSSGTINFFADALAKLEGGRDIHIIGFDNDESASFDNVMLASLQNLQKQAEEAARTAGDYIRCGSFPNERYLFIKNKVIQRNRTQAKNCVFED